MDARIPISASSVTGKGQHRPMLDILIIFLRDQDKRIYRGKRVFPYKFVITNILSHISESRPRVYAIQQYVVRFTLSNGKVAFIQVTGLEFQLQGVYDELQPAHG